MDFTAIPENTPTPIPLRRSANLLPQGTGFIKDSNRLRKFLNTTLDQWIQVPQISNDSGYIGQKNGLYYLPADDFYLQEPTSDRNNYQLEATTTSVDADSNINYVQFYQDLVDYLDFNGGITNNHNRLFSQEFYSWAPPINVDMLINFSNYYWILIGPEVITVTDSTNVVLDIIGQTNYTTTSGLVLQSGMKIILTDDANFEYNNIPFIVEGVGKSIVLIDDSAYSGFGLYDVLPFDTATYDSAAVQQIPDYVTIERGDQDKNPWSTGNRWFHKDLIGSIDLTDSLIIQASRPIIEFEKNIELMNYGRYARTDVNYLSSVVGVLDIAGQTSYRLDGNTLYDGDRILFTNDPDPLKNNRIYKVFGIDAYGVIGLSLETDGLDSTGAPVTGEKVRILSGDTYGSDEFYFSGTSWVICQAKTSSSQQPSFVLYDSNSVRLDNISSYPGSTFAGNGIFSYTIDNTQPIDPFLGIPIDFTTFGAINFDNDLQVDRYSYELNFATTEIDGYYYFRQFTNTDPTQDIFRNEWNKSEIESRQFVEDDFVIEQIVADDGTISFNRTYTLSITPDANTSSQTNYIVYLNGQALVDGTDYDISGNTLNLSLSLTLADNDVLESTTYASEITEQTINGFFQIPKNLEANPNNLEVTTLSYSDIYGQFISIIQNQAGIQGSPYGLNDYNSTPRDLSKGDFILQHTAPMPQLMLLSDQNNNLDILTSVRYCNREYSRIKKKFINKINDFLTKGYDSTVPTTTWVSDALNQINVGKTSSFPFYNSGMTGSNNFIPSTPAALGITPVYQPTLLLDTTRLNPTNIIIGHDGSIINAYNNVLDSVILEFETQIYNSIQTTYSNIEVKREFEYLNYIPGYSRDTEYSRTEWLTLSQPAFERWVVDNQVDYITNSIYDQTNPFTWNYSKSHGPNGELLPGNWRGIYQYIYDTQRPHTNPWEMLGYSQQPTWWVSQYGSAPWTGANITMWTDLENGTIAQGPRAGTYSYLARPGLTSIIPVDDSGNLLDPIQAGIVQDVPGVNDADADWLFGDIGPGEYTWRCDTNYSFSLSEALYLAKPAKFSSLCWDSNKFERVNGQLVDSATLERREVANLTVQNEILADGSTSQNFGISQFTSSYLTSLGIDITSNFGDTLRELNVQLGYRVAGFTKNNTLRLVNDSFGIVPQENVHQTLYKSNSISQPIYSGVVVEWSGSGYRVSGYDTVGQRFVTLPGVPTGQRTDYTFENITVSRMIRPGNSTQEVLYGTELHSRQAVFDFFTNYQFYLLSQGWIFDQLEPISGQYKDFILSAQEFIAWSSNNLQPGDAIVLSPLADQAKITVAEGMVDNIQMFVNGVYSVLDQKGFGITADKFDISRLDNEFTVTMNATASQGIYALRLSIIQYEHIIIIDNVTDFNDLVYEPLLGLRQPRFRAFIQRTIPWTGKPEANGFVIRDNDLLDNFETSVDNIENLFSLNNIESDSITEQVAKHQIGYQDRPYLDNLLLSKTSQFEFYRGFIREVGTLNSFQKILRNNFVTQTADFDILEEWAFSLGEYGNTTKKSDFQIQIEQSDFRTNPQEIDFVTSSTPSPDDNNIEITPSDPRWIQMRHSNSTINQFALRNFVNNEKVDLPNAGYIQVNEADFSVVTIDQLANLYTTEQLAGTTLADGNLIWNIIAPNQQWNVFRLCSTDLVSAVTAGENVGDPVQITLQSDQDLVAGDIIYIIGSTPFQLLCLHCEKENKIYF